MRHRYSTAVREIAGRVIFSQYFPAHLFVLLANTRFIFLRSHTRFCVSREGLFVAREGSLQRHFADRSRGYVLYRDGVAQRFDRLFTSYLLHEVEFRRHDVVIDCGANYGDLWGTLSDRIHPTNYHAFEPSSRDFDVLRRNVSPSANCVKEALGNVDGVRQLYVSSGQGDSSLIEPADFDSVETCTVAELDSYCERVGINRIRLLKIEAEGFEVEVLEGASRSLEFTDFVCFDGSPERGLAKESTFSDVTNFLYASGFICLGVDFEWHRALFIKVHESGRA